MFLHFTNANIKNIEKNIEKNIDHYQSIITTGENLIFSSLASEMKNTFFERFDLIIIQNLLRYDLILFLIYTNT